MPGGGRIPSRVSAAALAATLTGSSDDVRDALAKAVEGELTLRLPGTARGPLPSPETGSETPGREIRLTEWETPVLLVPPDAALAALGALADPDPDGPWTAAASLRYLCVLAGHACDLSRRGRMLPQLVVEAGEPAARWRPVLTGGDAAAWRDFAEAMPPVCRAATADGVSPHPARRARGPGGRRCPGGHAGAADGRAPARAEGGTARTGWCSP